MVSVSARMLVYLLFFMRVLDEGAFTLPLPEEASTTTTPSSQNFQDGNFGDICALKTDDEFSYLMPWQEIPQRAQGCSVPFYGPQGHGQHPEEVHIVHITDISRMIQTLSSQRQAMAAINVWLDVAACENKTNWTDSHSSSKYQFKSMKNESLPFGGGKESSNSKRKKFPEILRLKDFSPEHPMEPLALHSKQETTYSFSAANTPIDFKGDGKRPLVLLLTSDQPVQWFVKPGVCWSEDTASKVQVVVEKNSKVDSDLPVEVVLKTWAKRLNRKNIQRYARRTFHGIASFTQIREANSVHILVGPGSSRDQEISRQLSFRNRNKLNFCDFGSREESHLISASLAVPLSAETCVLQKGNLLKSFIIEVKSTSTIFDKERTDAEIMSNSMSGKGSPRNLPSIIVLLTENMAANETDRKDTILPGIASLNVTVVLVSKQPIRWVLTSLIQQSNIHVMISENDLVDIINSSGSEVKVSSIKLPHPMTKLLRDVSSDVGSTVHYFLINHGTGFTLSVDSPVHQIQAVGKFHQQSSSPSIRLPPRFITQLQTFLPSSNLSEDERENRALSIVESDMVVVCGKSLVEIMLPGSILTELGVQTIHFKDRSCQSHYNGTHFLLSSQLKSCGSEIHISGKDSVMSNQVFVNFTPYNISDVHIGGSDILHNLKLKEIGVPVACSLKNKPVLDDDVVRTMLNSRNEMVSEEDEDIGNSSEGSDDSFSIYQLELYHGNLLTGSLNPIKNGDSLTDLNDRIYVRAWMDDAPLAQAVPESCWIDNLRNSAKLGSKQKIVLLHGMCPVKESVMLEQQASSFFPSAAKSFIFSFQISQEFLQLGQDIYIHCQIGVCISSVKHFKGKPIICVDPQDYCLHQQSGAPVTDAVSTAHQLLTRGPILISSLLRSDFADNAVPLENKCADVSAFPYPSAISVDMTVAIAVCSFIIGVGLTATLWLIHNKTDPSKHARHRREHSLGSRSAVMGSSLSPHSGCSSTNSQSAIA